MKILFDDFIPGLPIGQPRVKATSFGAHARVYTPNTADLWKAQVSEAVRAAGVQLTSPVFMRLSFFMPRPKYHFGSKGLKANAPSWHTSKPDIDNLVKAVLDSLGGIAFKNDSEVAKIEAAKAYSSTPGLQLIIWENEP